MPQDYYDVLGIRRDATAEDVRRAYRRLAREHHPDVNGSDAAAEQRFKTINEAYEVLRDPEKRAAYDRFGHAGVRGNVRTATPGDFGDLGDLFEQFFGFGGARGRPQQASRAERGADVRVRVRLSFEEAVFGTTRRVEVMRRETCETCDGVGAAPGTQPVPCATCGGTGQVRRLQQSILGSLVNIHTCPSCRGAGETIAQACSSCGGLGRVQRTRSLDVDIPAGVDGGVQVRLGGEGDRGRFGGPAGDLLIALEVEPHPYLRRQEFDLHLQLQVNPADAALGTDIEIPTLDGPTTLTLAPGTQTGDTFRLEGKGVPHLRRAGRGDQVVTVFVTTPRKLSREQKELLEKLRATLPQAEVVGTSRPSFWDRVRERFS